MRFVFVTTFLILISSLPCLSYEIPKSCNENEMTVVCMLKIQRNNSLDELAIAEAGRRDALAQANTLSAWWKDYVTGIDAQMSWWSSLWSKLLPSVVVGQREQRK